MLTENEREWLENREVIHQCEGDYIWAGYWEEGVELEVMKDAAEFSERVAVKMAKHIHNKPLVCETNWDCPYWPQGKCAWCYLKAARIEVEEEMDNGA